MQKDSPKGKEDRPVGYIFLCVVIMCISALLNITDANTYLGYIAITIGSFAAVGLFWFIFFQLPETFRKQGRQQERWRQQSLGTFKDNSDEFQECKRRLDDISKFFDELNWIIETYDLEQVDVESCDLTEQEIKEAQLFSETRDRLESDIDDISEIISSEDPRERIEEAQEIRMRMETLRREIDLKKVEAFGKSYQERLARYNEEHKEEFEKEQAEYMENYHKKMKRLKDLTGRDYM